MIHTMHSNVIMYHFAWRQGSFMYFMLRNPGEAFFFFLVDLVIFSPRSDAYGESGNEWMNGWVGKKKIISNLETFAHLVSMMPRHE